MLYDENDPAVAAELAGLTEGLSSWLGEDLDRETLQMLFDFIEEHRISARKRGIDFPKLTAFVVPRLGWIKLVRYELTEENIRRAILSLVRECPQVLPHEIATAVKNAWPDRKLSGVVDEAETKLIGV